MDINITNLFDDAPALIAILKGPDHVFEYANKLYHALLNQKEKSIIGLSVKEAFPEMALQGINVILDNVFINKKDYKTDEVKLNLNVDDKGLTEFYFNLIYNPIKNREGNVEGIFIHAIDVTILVQERKKAEQSSVFMEKLIMNAPVATALYNTRDLIINLANDKMISLMGKSVAILGKKLADALPELNDQPFLDLLDNVFNTGIAYHANEQKCMLEVDNEIKTYWFNFTYKPILDESGKVISILNMAIDVTASVVAKQKLMLAETKLRTAIEVANLGTWEWEPETNLITFNDKLKEWLGINNGNNITAKKIFSLLPYSNTIASKIENALKYENGGILNIEYTIQQANTGETRVIQSSGKTFFDEQKKPFLMAGLAQDITMQKLTETELAKKVDLKTEELNTVNNDLTLLNANLEQFVYVASHDLQEPLRKINIFSDMLLKNVANDLNKEGKVYIEKIAKAAKRMSLLINDLLEFSRLSSRDKVFVATDLNKIIKDIVIDYELLISQKNATLSIDVLPVIEAIPLQMNQLFYNLIGNALKFSKNDIEPTIKITSAVLSPEEVTTYRLNPDYHYCSINVLDNGIGFNQKYAHQIFEIFQRLHGKQEFAGTGIGLALVKKIADNHNGMIVTSSNENEGALFKIILPVQR